MHVCLSTINYQKEETEHISGFIYNVYKKDPV